MLPGTSACDDSGALSLSSWGTRLAAERLPPLRERARSRTSLPCIGPALPYSVTHARRSPPVVAAVTARPAPPPSPSPPAPAATRRNPYAGSNRALACRGLECPSVDGVAARDRARPTGSGMGCRWWRDDPGGTVSETARDRGRCLQKFELNGHPPRAAECPDRSRCGSAPEHSTPPSDRTPA